MTTFHTPGPWQVMPDREHKGKHPLHESRYVTTADFEEREHGSIICALRDQAAQAADARLIASAPALLAALEETVTDLEDAWEQLGVRPTAVSATIHRARAAIKQAKGE